MIEKLEMTCDDGSHASWEPKKPGARLNRVHQVDLHMRKDIKVSFVSRPDLSRCKVVIQRGGRTASLFHDRFKTVSTYNANGCLTKKNDGGNETEYQWDHDLRLTGLSTTDEEYAFAYGPQGRLVGITQEIGATTEVTRSLWDGCDVLVEYDGQGNVENQYTHGPDVDEHLIIESNGSSYYYLTDGLGSVTLVVDSSEDVVEEYLYTPYGSDLYPESMGFGGGPGSSVDNSYKFTGRREVMEDLYYYRSRWYVPSGRRFISRDLMPLYSYRYCAGNPVNRTDPTGLMILPSASDGPVATGASAVLWNYENLCGLTVTLPDSEGNPKDYGDFYYVELAGLLSRSFSYPEPRPEAIPGADWSARKDPGALTVRFGLPGTSYTNNSPLKRSEYWRLRTWCERAAGKPFRVTPGRFASPSFIGEALRRAGYIVPPLFTYDRLWLKRYFLDNPGIWEKQY